jgi:hypothetical protein
MPFKRRREDEMVVVAAYFRTPGADNNRRRLLEILILVRDILKVRGRVLKRLYRLIVPEILLSIWDNKGFMHIFAPRYFAILL